MNTWTISYKSKFDVSGLPTLPSKHVTDNEIANFEDQLRKKEEIIRELEDKQAIQSRSLEAMRIEEQKQQSVNHQVLVPSAL